MRRPNFFLIPDGAPWRILTVRCTLRRGVGAETPWRIPSKMENTFLVFSILQSLLQRCPEVTVTTIINIYYLSLVVNTVYFSRGYRGPHPYREWSVTGLLVMCSPISYDLQSGDICVAYTTHTYIYSCDVLRLVVMLGIVRNSIAVSSHSASTQ